MRPMTEIEAIAAKDIILRIVDSSAYGVIRELLEGQLAIGMLNARDAVRREEIAAEYRVMEKFLNTLTEISNQVRGA